MLGEADGQKVDLLVFPELAVTGYTCQDLFFQDALYQGVLEALGKQPLITAGMHLGEGTGAVAAMPLLDMACAVYHGCYTFDDGGIEAYQPLGDSQ